VRRPLAGVLCRILRRGDAARARQHSKDNGAFDAAIPHATGLPRTLCGQL
jgi:hypothetical protein